MSEVIGTYRQPPDGWVCFFCGERFTNYGLALDHFGEYPIDEAICQIIRRSGVRGLTIQLRKALSRARRLQDEIDLLESQIPGSDSYRLIGEAETLRDAIFNYDSMEGRALAAEAVIDEIEKKWPALVEVSRRRI